MSPSAANTVDRPPLKMREVSRCVAPAPRPTRRRRLPTQGRPRRRRGGRSCGTGLGDGAPLTHRPGGLPYCCHTHRQVRRPLPEPFPHASTQSSPQCCWPLASRSGITRVPQVVRWLMHFENTNFLLRVCGRGPSSWSELYMLDRVGCLLNPRAVATWNYFFLSRYIWYGTNFFICKINTTENWDFYLLVTHIIG